MKTWTGSRRYPVRYISISGKNIWLNTRPFTYCSQFYLISPDNISCRLRLHASYDDITCHNLTAMKWDLCHCQVELWMLIGTSMTNHHSWPHVKTLTVHFLWRAYFWWEPADLGRDTLQSNQPSSPGRIDQLQIRTAAETVSRTGLKLLVSSLTIASRLRLCSLWWSCFDLTSWHLSNLTVEHTPEDKEDGKAEPSETVVNHASGGAEDELRHELYQHRLGRRQWVLGKLADLNQTIATLEAIGDPQPKLSWPISEGLPQSSLTYSERYAKYTQPMPNLWVPCHQLSQYFQLTSIIKFTLSTQFLQALQQGICVRYNDILRKFLPPKFPNSSLRDIHVGIVALKIYQVKLTQKTVASCILNSLLQVIK